MTVSILRDCDFVNSRESNMNIVFSRSCLKNILERLVSAF
ncbi:hypothetical protein LEP1GSC016_0497 [Leptospira borgpetersenii serovar Hardjo-bovis str. Sponselee]|uniref:Uncharacterized protein n=1 Tax=Leptospira borgpetersenii serovar Hardjo-bovis str. Sponselee TaxID=1303729 RepID=M6BJ96_LEPBO|nr:hypothetical protein LEP1GSC016_0497 [Leptospira borgpetersenii serovar Hardjo-bovis str. Sponselee]